MNNHWTYQNGCEIKKNWIIYFLWVLYKQFSSKMNHELDEVDAVPRRVGLYNVKYRYNNEEHVTEVLLRIGKHN